MTTASARGNRLSRARISAAALDVVDRDGLDALTMRRLARELDVAPMTLYGHVRDKEDLLDAVVEAAAERHWDGPRQGAWQDCLKAVARELHRGLLAHPALVQLRLRRPIVSPSALRGTEVAMRALVDAGFDMDAAARAFRVVFLYVFGAAAFNLPEVPDRVGRELQAVAVSLPPDEYPTVSRAGAALAATLGGEEQFELGLDAVVAGIDARLAPPA